MNVEQLIKLVDAGFTADEIRAMTAKTEPTETPTADEGATTVTNPTPTATPVETNGNNGYEALVSRLDTLTGQLQKMALLGAVQPVAKSDDLSDFLASVINPRLKEEKKNG